MRDQALADALANGQTEEEFEQQWQMAQAFLGQMIQRAEEKLDGLFFPEDGATMNLVLIDGEWYVDPEDPFAEPEDDDGPVEEEVEPRDDED